MAYGNRNGASKTSVSPPPVSPLIGQSVPPVAPLPTSGTLIGSPLPPRYRFRELLLLGDAYNTYADDGERYDNLFTSIRFYLFCMKQKIVFSYKQKQQEF